MEELGTWRRRVVSVGVVVLCEKGKRKDKIEVVRLGNEYNNNYLYGSVW